MNQRKSMAKKLIHWHNRLNGTQKSKSCYDHCYYESSYWNSLARRLLDTHTINNKIRVIHFIILLHAKVLAQSPAHWGWLSCIFNDTFDNPCWRSNLKPNVKGTKGKHSDYLQLLRRGRKFCHTVPAKQLRKMSFCTLQKTGAFSTLQQNRLCLKHV